MSTIRKPLTGKRVMVTRSPDQSTAFATLLAEAGATPIVIPAIVVGPPADWRPMDEAIGRLGDFDWVVFTSSNGVDYFFKRLAHAKKNVSALAGNTVATVGRATANTLRGHGREPDFMPSRHTSEVLVQEMGEARLKGKRVLTPRSDIAPDTIVKEMTRMGAMVHDVPAYHTSMPEESRTRAVKAITGREVDIVTFTSSSTVMSLMTLLGSQARQLINQVTIACIGPVTAKTADENGLRVDVMAKDNTTAGLVEALEEWAGRKGA
jgi:uroporphyrinogen III methyltransferase/synthase